ncbi:nucleotidyl transferase AbiEii/AbiGii toxin family protein [Echinicola sp. CAU 1574]|uniref:Nucleotidyl transferase AbiEii/AbiGii toxin family protein n=1 Tax=Echinicola arenosa TaxID=2774144 RepID=A0ABR9AIS0_9BACT|nr:nucleotidyl transferase AbiEii/AbiGii toxin family protein [Echinicola arenosa]MBD8488222.1 nucleotidyl transferase AbiEii/AbiGii toxin family protein [Echinicola arenosa]
MSGKKNNSLPDNFSEFIKALNANNVEYLVIGGFAMGAYGYIRSTGDLDIFINATTDNAKRAIKACTDFGIDKEDVTEEMFLIPKMVGIGQPPLRIEILKKLDVVDFNLAYKRAEKKHIDDQIIPVVSLDDLILLKQAAVKDRSKERDIEDLNYLKKLKATLKGPNNKKRWKFW